MHAHRFQQRQTQPPLHEMLRLVMQIRLAAPADDKDAGNSVDLLVQQGEQRVDNVAEPAVLEIDERRLSRRKVITCRKRCRTALVCRNHMRGAVRPVRVHQIVHERAQLRVRYARKELRAKRRDEFAYVHRCSFLSFPNHSGLAACISGQISPLFASTCTILRARG